jgi:hypothetical protein
MSIAFMVDENSDIPSGSRESGGERNSATQVSSSLLLLLGTA